MRVKTFAQFFYKDLKGNIVEALGDRSVLILDGRVKIINQLEWVRQECWKRGYIGFTINRGTFSDNHVLRIFESVIQYTQEEYKEWLAEAKAELETCPPQFKSSVQLLIQILEQHLATLNDAPTDRHAATLALMDKAIKE